MFTGVTGRSYHKNVRMQSIKKLVIKFAYFEFWLKAEQKIKLRQQLLFEQFLGMRLAILS